MAVFGCAGSLRTILVDLRRMDKICEFDVKNQMAQQYVAMLCAPQGYEYVLLTLAVLEEPVPRNIAAAHEIRLAVSVACRVAGRT